MTWPRSLLALLVVVLAARVAAADDVATRAARRHFERGQKLYAATKFREALDEYQQAFDARPLPDFLFNIGQCYRNLGDYDSAIFSYKKYLAAAADAPNRPQVEQLIAELQTRKDQEDARRLALQPPPPLAPPPPAAPPPTPPPPAARPIYARWWFWTGVGVVAAGAGVATYELTRPGSGPPSTSLGNIVFGK
ncbi:MAG TPA: tetratricopeptide repeat protein [Kofleriaceae bacterium]|nr:tetratricopeptide repeat protein [Kofleriaceae bacterium]